MTHEIFISYCQPDRNFAFFIHDLLVKNGFSVWVAGSISGGVTSGHQYKEDIVRAISGCKVFILVYSEYVNKSRDVKNELTLAEKKIILPVRRDMSEMCRELKYDLARLEYIDATGPDNSILISRLLQDLRKHISNYTDPQKGSMDKVLFRQGVGLLKAGQYKMAKKILEQYMEIAPRDPEAAFYLSVCIRGGQVSHKLDGLIVLKIEELLTPVAITRSFPAANYLLAMIKFGYYRLNNLREPAPRGDELINGIVLSKAWVAEILALTNESGNLVWNFLKKAEHK